MASDRAPSSPPVIPEGSADPAIVEAVVEGRGPRRPLFLHRETYRRRRVMDAARLLPFLGVALLLLPMLWADSHRTSMGAVYLFLAWLGLIVGGGIMARSLSEPLRSKPPPEDGRSP